MLKVSQISLKHRLHNISFEMNAGECWHVLGQNGAGKSSLFDAISGLVTIDSGSIEIDETNISTISIAELSSRLAYLQQKYTLSFSLKVDELLDFYAGHKEVPADIEKALSLSPLMSRSLQSLSGGEQQRVHIARCLMQVWHSIERGEAIILLDEPIQSLDVAHQENALTLFKYFAGIGNLVVLSIHDVNLSLRFSDHVLMLKNKTDHQYGKSEDVMNAKNITELYDYPFGELKNEQNAEKIFIRAQL